MQYVYIHAHTMLCTHVASTVHVYYPYIYAIIYLWVVTPHHFSIGYLLKQITAYEVAVTYFDYVHVQVYIHMYMYMYVLLMPT